MQHFDDIIIGFGKGGKTLAGYLAGKGRQVALIEKDKQMYGGTCINVGCIPSKSLVTSGLNAQRAGADLTFAASSNRYAAAIAEKRRVTGMLRQKNYAKLAGNPHAKVIDGTAAFVSNTEITVQTEAGVENFTAERFFINTGSVSVIPPIPGLKDNPLAFDSKSLMELDTLPRRLAIIGGGYIGLEFASMYATFGSQVTVVQDAPTLVPREDRDIAAALQQVLEQKGVRFVLGAAITGVTHQGNCGYGQLHPGRENRNGGSRSSFSGDRPPSQHGRSEPGCGRRGSYAPGRGENRRRPENHRSQYLGHGRCGRGSAVHLRVPGRFPHRERATGRPG
jgi:pyruvate/2-oxoglutarate dehydrogenase complex dihydrolipoamide dehydrogenase (E3) component